MDDCDCAICGHPRNEHITNEAYVVKGQFGFKGGCRMDWAKWPPGEDCGCPGYLAPKTT